MGGKSSTSKGGDGQKDRDVAPQRAAAKDKPVQPEQPPATASVPERVQPKAKPVMLPKANPAWNMPPHYQVIKAIGKGSYGSVSECRDTRKDKLVAAKQMKGLFDDLMDCKRILRELAILTKLNSDQVVKVEDIVIPGPQDRFNEIYIVLEICDSDMKKLVKSDVLLSPLHINTLLYNLLVGLKYIHSAGVYHRDLKPANCLVNRDCSVKICDFGLARALGGSKHGADVQDFPQPSGSETRGENQVLVVPSTLTEKRIMTQHVVTRWYRAPELILLQQGYTEAVDMWSVGCIFAELLQMQEGTSIRFLDRGPLFPGSSCFPLSPDRRHSAQKSRAKNDQLETIFNIIGTPKDEEVKAIGLTQEACKYLSGFTKTQGEGLAAHFPDVGSDALELLACMLRFLPSERCRVEQALEHRIFGDSEANGRKTIRDVNVERKAAAPIELGFNDAVEIPAKELRRLFLAEMEKFEQII